MKTMNSLHWIRSSIGYHARMHIVLAAGAALAGAILAAVLLAGDALNTNLRRIALARVGPLSSAIELRGRYADSSLADRLTQQTGTTVAPMLRLSSSVLAVDDAGSEMRVDRVNAYGVDERFLGLAGKAETWPSSNAVLLSSRLAAAVPEASLSLRFEKPSLFPSDMPLGDAGDDAQIRRPIRPQGMLTDAELGRFSLRASQVPPFNLFVPRDWLGNEVGLPAGANLFVSDAQPEQLADALRVVFKPSDVGVTITREADGIWQIRPERIFLDTAFVEALTNAALEPVLNLHHLADSFVAGEGDKQRERPYGFITAQTPSTDPRVGVVPADMEDDEVVINAWLADQLNVRIGDALTIRLRRFEAGGGLVPDQATFRIIRILEMADINQEREWLPAFPGLTDADRCADWDIGMPMDPDKLNDADNEAYWNEYGPTPKAFITLNAGQSLLGTVFGGVMNARLPPDSKKTAIVAALRQADPAALGMVVRPIRQEALEAVDQAMDFREIFGSMAFILVISAMILTGLLAALAVSQRREEIGILRSSGFSNRRLGWLWLFESLPALFVGSIGGVLMGLLGARLLVWGLNRFWSGAIASAQIPFSLSLQACLLSGGLALSLSLVAVRWGIHRTVNLSIESLLKDEMPMCAGRGSRRWAALLLLCGMLSLLSAIVLFVMGNGDDGGDANAGIFFGGGALLMTALLCVMPLLVHGLQARRRSVADPVRAGLFNVARYRGRSILVMILLASGCFITVGVLSMKQDPSADSDRHDAGGGGFDMMVEMSIPQPSSRAESLVREALESTATILPVRVREGDEASCLNLNRAVEPRLLGIDPKTAADLSAFEPASGDSVWTILETSLSDGSIPVLAGDLTTVQYGLAAKTGAENGTIYTYAGEDGRVWRLRLMGALPVRTSILQGSLIMSRAVFSRLFPSTPGDGLVLVQSKRDGADVRKDLSRTLGRYGGLVTPVRERLKMLGAVESTYLDMFLVLGGLGVVLGAAGVGLVVLRNAAARRRELAILRALGIPARTTLVYLMAEYVYLLIGGLLAGVVPALIAIQPAMRSLGQTMPVGLMIVLIMAMLVSGLLGIMAAVVAASRMRLVEALHGE